MMTEDINVAMHKKDNERSKKHETNPGKGRIFFSPPKRPAPSSVGICVLSPELKWPEREVNHSSPHIVEFKNGWSPVCLCGMHGKNLRLFTDVSVELGTSIFRVGR